MAAVTHLELSSSARGAYALDPSFQPYRLLLLYFLRQSLIEPRACHFSCTSWPASVKDLSVSTSPGAPASTGAGGQTLVLMVVQ